MQVPGLADCIAAAKRLNQVLRRKSNESLDDVLTSAAATALKEFVANLRRDLSAVQAALDLPWTTSPAEGQISRLKMLKRTIMAALASIFSARASYTPRDLETARKSRENLQSARRDRFAIPAACQLESRPRDWSPAH